MEIHRSFVYFAELLLFDDINRAYNGILIKEDNFMLYLLIQCILLFILACYFVEAIDNDKRRKKRKEEEEKKKEIRKTFNIDIH